MNLFDCYPILFDENAPHPDIVIKNLLNKGQIPLRVVSDKSDPMFNELKEGFEDYNIKYFIVIIVYLHKFQA